jgi:hypothetical protein
MNSETALARVGNVDVSKFETATGARLRLRHVTREPLEAYLDPLELEGLTRARHKAFAPLGGAKGAREETLSDTARLRDALARSAAGQPLERLQNEFALVGVAVMASPVGETLFIRDMNAGQAIALTAEELEALLRARHMDYAPLVDTSDLVAVPEPDIDEV